MPLEAPDLDCLAKTLESMLDRFKRSASIVFFDCAPAAVSKEGKGRNARDVINFALPKANMATAIRQAWESDRRNIPRSGIVFPDNSIMTVLFVCKSLPMPKQLSTIEKDIEISGSDGPVGYVDKYSYCFYPNSKLADEIGYFRYDYHFDKMGDGDLGEHTYFHFHRRSDGGFRHATGPMFEFDKLVSGIETILAPKQRAERLKRDFLAGEFRKLLFDLTVEGIFQLHAKLHGRQLTNLTSTQRALLDEHAHRWSAAMLSTQAADRNMIENARMVSTLNPGEMVLMKKQTKSIVGALVFIATATTLLIASKAGMAADAAAEDTAAANAGILAYKSGSYQRAANLLNEEVHPELATNATAMYYRANAFVQIGRPRYALEHYKKARAITQDPAMVKLCDQAIAALQAGLLQGTIKPGLPENQSPNASADSARRQTGHATTVSDGNRTNDVTKKSNTASSEIMEGPRPTPYDLSLVQNVASGPEADAVYKAVSLAVAAIPLPIKHQLDAAGVRWKVVSTLVEYNPECAGKISPGWEGKDYSYVGGTVLRKSNEVIIAVRARRTKDGVLDLTNHRRRCTLHETGHAVDHIVLNSFSKTAEFREAYTSDSDRLTAAQREQHRFSLQAGDAGPAETFATLFAQAVEEKANLQADRHFNDITTTFPRAFEVVKRLIN